MREKTLQLLGLMKRAGALVTGESNTGSIVHSGKARLLLLASDASENAKKRAEAFASGRSVQMVPLPFTKEELADHLGQGACSMAAVTDMGFAKALTDLLNQQWPENYGAIAEETKRRYERMKKRRRTAGEGKKSIGKRRTNV